MCEERMEILDKLHMVFFITMLSFLGLLLVLQGNIRA